MDETSTNYKTPDKIYKRAVKLFLIGLVIMMIYLITGNSETQQNGFGYSILYMVTFLIVLFIIALYTTIIYKEWFKHNRYINLGIFFFVTLIVGYLAYSVIVNGSIG